jgi:hypothetical protein
MKLQCDAPTLDAQLFRAFVAMLAADPMRVMPGVLSVPGGNA